MSPMRPTRSLPSIPSPRPRSWGRSPTPRVPSGQKNIWGTVPKVVEMQSEGGAAGAVHGALQAGALTTTFTASQGLLLMIPNMYKIAGELTPTVFHVSARAIAAQALSIFGDHSDVMACRQTGWTMLCSNNIQEVMDFALIAQATTLESRVPVLHYFDGFRTSHEVQKVEELDPERHEDDDQRRSGLRPPGPRPVARSSGDARHRPEPGRLFHGPRDRQSLLRKGAGHPAGADGQVRRAHWPPVQPGRLRRASPGRARGGDAGLRLRGHGRAHPAPRRQGGEGRSGQDPPVPPLPDRSSSAKALPASVKKITVLDRTKEPGSIGEPLYQAVRTAIGEGMGDGLVSFDGYPSIVGGRYGLGSFEFNAGMCKAVLDNMLPDKPMNHFIVGFKDDVIGQSLDLRRELPGPLRRLRGHVLRPRLATAPSAPTRTRSRSSATPPTTRSRPTSSTTPRRPAA